MSDNYQTNEKEPIVRNIHNKQASNVESKTDILVPKRKQLIPDDILQNDALNQAIQSLPINYNFEIHKIVWRIKSENPKIVALQFPDGLLQFSCKIAQMVEIFTNCPTVILGDVTYGACCVDDLAAVNLGAEFLVHFGHSCLIPINFTKIKGMYVFVEISFNVSHLQSCIVSNLTNKDHIIMMGTVQFISSIYCVKSDITVSHPEYTITIPQEKPLSAGEVLGCTSPDLSLHCLPNVRNVVVFVADGRFHLESLMIRNRTAPVEMYLRYDPYSKQLVREEYDHECMRNSRWSMIEQVRTNATVIGVVLGTLGRQGNPAILNWVESMLMSACRDYIVILLSEISPAALKLFDEVDAWVEIACPRLAIDWSASYAKPIITPYELDLCFNGSNALPETYSMDYYSKQGGLWSNRNYYDNNSNKKKIK